MFIHLHTRSYYSFLAGVLSPRELARSAFLLGMNSLALTDFNSLTGSIEFYTACLEENVKPILGLELAFRHPFGNGNLVLLAKDYVGWSSLCNLSSIVQCQATKDQPVGIDLNQLMDSSSGLICLSGGNNSLVSQLVVSERHVDALHFLDQLHDCFSDNLYIEAQFQQPQDQYLINQLRSISNQVHIPLVATNNVHYKTANQARIQHVLSAIRMNTTLKTIKPDSCFPECAFSTIEEMQNKFKDIPEAVTNSQFIADQCNLEIPIGAALYPEIILPPGETALSRLGILANQGAAEKYGEDYSFDIQERLNHELEVIGEQGYAPIFLIVQEILEFARSNGVPVSSRGSAASSLVAFCLGITTPDPIALNLYFERFLNPARSSPPDIDIDLCSKRREKVIRHVYEQYGENQVAMVATINRFQKRSALREVAKTFGVPDETIKKLIGSLPSRNRKSFNSQKGNFRGPYDDLKLRFPGQSYQSIFDVAAAIIGIPRHLSVHPGGIVITSGPLTKHVPTQMGTKNLKITQFDTESIERLGLVKIDLLGTRGLTVLGDVAEKVSKWRSTEYKSSLDVLETISDDDTETKKLLSEVRTIGCFALESPGMRMTLREIRAQSPEDIMIGLALYRPGPMIGGLKETFIRRHLGQEPIQHIHPTLSDLLGNTHGVILYQEQVLRIASQLAGLSLADSDLLRRAMSHFDPGDQMKTLKLRFLEGAQEKSGVPYESGEKLWELMAAFAGYGFPKAHAASYAQVAWHSAWCKAHYPAEFMAAVLAGHGGYYRQYVYINEARRLGFTICPPHINHSMPEFCATYPKGNPSLYMGFNQVRDLTRKTQKRIQNNRPFYSLDDFLTKVDPLPKEVNHLIQVGAFNGLGTIPNLLAKIESGRWRLGQPRLFELPNDRAPYEDWDLSQKMIAQRNYLGIGVEAHPMELVKDKINFHVIPNQAAKAMIGIKLQVAGIRQSIQIFRDNTGNPYYYLELDDSKNILPVRIPTSLYRSQKGIFSSIDPFVIEGTMIVEPILNFEVLNALKVHPIQ